MNSLIFFTNLLHKCGRPDAPEVQEFLSKHSDDPTFRARAEAVLMGYSVRANASKAPTTSSHKAK